MQGIPRVLLAAVVTMRYIVQCEKCELGVEILWKAWVTIYFFIKRIFHKKSSTAKSSHLSNTSFYHLAK